MFILNSTVNPQDPAIVVFAKIFLHTILLHAINPVKFLTLNKTEKSNSSFSFNFSSFYWNIYF